MPERPTRGVKPNYALAMSSAAKVAYMVSPSQKERDGFQRLHDQLNDSRAGLSKKQQVQQLLDAISDGIKYGNWPTPESDFSLDPEPHWENTHTSGD